MAQNQPSPPRSSTGNGNGSGSDGDHPSFQRRATPRQEMIDRVRKMMFLTSALALHYQQVLLNLLRAPPQPDSPAAPAASINDPRPRQVQQPATPAVPAAPAAPINNPPSRQLQQQIRPTLNLALAPSQIALAAPLIGGRSYGLNVSSVNEIGRATMNGDLRASSGGYGRKNVNLGNGVYATPTILVRPPPWSTPAAVTLADISGFTPRPTSASGSLGLELLNFGPFKSRIPRPNQASSSPNDRASAPPPPSAHPFLKHGVNMTANGKVYWCATCQILFLDGHAFSGHFQSHNKREDREAREKRRAMKKMNKQSSKRPRHQCDDLELCLTQSAQGLTVVPAQMERESTLLVRYQKKNKSGDGESSGGGGGQTQVRNNQSGSVTVKQESAGV